MDEPSALKELLPTIFGGSGLLVALKMWVDARGARRAETEAKAVQRTDLIKIAQEAAGAVIADLRTEVGRLHKQLSDVEAEFATFRKAHDMMIADREAELALLRGENRELKAAILAYERLLTANNIPHERPPRPFYELRDGRVEAVIAEPPNL